MVKATANKIILRGNLVKKPSDNDSFFTAVRANRIAVGSAINNRRKSRSEIKRVHSQKKCFKKTSLSGLRCFGPQSRVRDIIGAGNTYSPRS